jgi:serine/threonine-protein kinase RsbT
MPDEERIAIATEGDIVTARRRGRELAAEGGFSGSDLTVIATAISELARNIVAYARAGEMTLRVVRRGDRSGLIVIARDEGPGIDDVSLVMQDGFSTGRSLGLGLPGAKRLMDEFEIASELGRGTTVTMTKWS